MGTARVEDQLTEQLTQKLDESKYLHFPLMNRIEAASARRNSSRTYTGMLVHKLEARKFADEWLIDRIDRILDLQRRLRAV